MANKKMLYIMGIDWEWIYQRPQILAEKLTADYSVTVVFPRSITIRNKQLPTDTNIDFRILWTIPFQEKNTLIGKISKILNKTVFSDVADFDYIYIGYPIYERYIPTEYTGIIIYDCMDNQEALYPDRKRIDVMTRHENALIKRCQILLASATMLQQKVDGIAGFPKSVLIRNGVNVDKIYDVKKVQYRRIYSLCYIGTISQWFDYELILESTKKLSNIQYHMIGPGNQRVECNEIIYHGIIPHSQLWENIKDYDCLIMPFIVNDIVEMVDPVKLYEYIAFGKCIVSVYYPEIERFSDYIYFYRTNNEYFDLLKKLSDNGFPPKYIKQQQEKFLKENTWNTRYQILQETLQMPESPKFNL